MQYFFPLLWLHWLCDWKRWKNVTVVSSTLSRDTTQKKKKSKTYTLASYLCLPPTPAYLCFFIQCGTVAALRGGCEEVLRCLRPKGMNYGRVETVNGPLTGQGIHSARWHCYYLAITDGLINILMVGRRNIVNKIIYWAPFAFFSRSLTLLVRNGSFGEEWATTWRQGRLLSFFFSFLFFCCTSSLGVIRKCIWREVNFNRRIGVVCKVLVAFCGRKQRK